MQARVEDHALEECGVISWDSDIGQVHPVFNILNQLGHHIVVVAVLEYNGYPVVSYLVHAWKIHSESL